MFWVEFKMDCFWLICCYRQLKYREKSMKVNIIQKILNLLCLNFSDFCAAYTSEPLQVLLKKTTTVFAVLWSSVLHLSFVFPVIKITASDRMAGHSHNPPSIMNPLHTCLASMNLRGPAISFLLSVFTVVWYRKKRGRLSHLGSENLFVLCCCLCHQCVLSLLTGDWALSVNLLTPREPG